MKAKTSALLATVLVGTTAALGVPAMAMSPEGLDAKAEVVIDAPESGELVAGRRFRRRSNFERFYLRNCRFRFRWKQCYRLYRRSRIRRRRIFDRYDDPFGDRFRRRRRYRVRLKDGRSGLKREVRLRDRRLRQRDRRTGHLEDRVERRRERNLNRRRRRERLDNVY